MNKPVTQAASAAQTQPQPQASAAETQPRKVEARQRRLDKLRVLPVLMIVGTLTFCVKVGNVWTDADAIFSGVPAAQAEEEPKPAADAKTAPAAEQAAAGTETAKTGAAADQTAADAKGADTDTQDAKADTRDWDSSEPYSQGELQILENLADRRKALDERTRELDMRERVLSAMEKRIDDKIAEMKKIQAKVASYLKNYDEQHVQRLQRLVKMYETMKPKDAARIFEQLHMDILVEVATNMKERQMSAILADMSPDAAKALTVELATKKPIPLASN